jgi:hypothetical protein
MLAVQAPQFGLPFVVLLHVTARENAVFYLSWGATSFMFLVPQMLGQILLIEHGDHPAVLRSQVRFCMKIAAGATACALLLSVAGASLVAVLYGSAYREVAVVLPLMIAGSFGWALTAPLLARARLLGDAVASIGIAVAFGGFVLGGAQLLVPLHGVAGASAAWVVGNAGALAVAWALTARAPARDQIVVPDLARQPVALRVGAEEEA